MGKRQAENPRVPVVGVGFAGVAKEANTADVRSEDRQTDGPARQRSASRHELFGFAALAREATTEREYAGHVNDQNDQVDSAQLSVHSIRCKAATRRLVVCLYCRLIPEVAQDFLQTVQILLQAQLGVKFVAMIEDADRAIVTTLSDGLVSSAVHAFPIQLAGSCSCLFSRQPCWRLPFHSDSGRADRVALVSKAAAKSSICS